MNQLTELLKKSGKDILKGSESHHKVAPTINGGHFRNFNPPPDAYHSAVLILIRKINHSYEILFTLRSSNLNSHKGQISFPGGRVENGESFVDTAFRETYEEIGLESNKIELILQLSTLYVPPSNTIIHPFIGALNEDFHFAINKNEVEEAFWIPLDYFLDDANLTVEKWNFGGQIVDVPLWKIHPKQVLWGATAMILSEFIDIYKNANNFVK